MDISMKKHIAGAVRTVKEIIRVVRVLVNK